MRIPTHIMIHHSLTEDNETVSAAAIHWFHIENGWRDIGYHALVEQIIDYQKHPHLESYAYGAIIGRPVTQVAAACPQGGMNTKALHVCCVGNFDLVAPSLAQLECLTKRVVIPWMDQFGIPAENIVGHRDFNILKTCPGLKFDLDLLRRMVR